MLRVLYIAIFVIVLSVGQAYTQDFEQAVAAYEAGDYETAFRKWSALAVAGDPDALYNLAVMYYQGDGVEVDHKQAAQLFRLAADQGHADAQFSLALMYREGDGVKVDQVEEVRLYQLAARQGHSIAQLNLGYAYHFGEGIEQSDLLAYMWYTIAEKNGNELAAQNLGAMEGPLMFLTIYRAVKMAEVCMDSGYTACE